MRIAFVIDRYRPGKGGLEAWLAALAAHLVAIGHEPHLLSQDEDAPAPFRHHRLVPGRRTRAGRDREFAEKARGAAARREFDAVVGLRHCLACDVYAPHGGSVAAGIEAHRSARLLPSLPSPRIRTFLALERELLTGSDSPRRILAVSESVRRDIGARFPGAADRIKVVPNGVDLGRFHPDLRDAARARLAPEGGRVVLFLAGNPRLKGWRVAREVFRILHDRGEADLLLVAGGRPGWIPKGGRYLGHTSRPEDALAAADLLLHPTHYDPFPLVTLEALACGTPVATTARNGAVDHVGRDGPVRAVIDPADAEGLAELAGDLLAAAPRDEARVRAEGFPLEQSLAAAVALITETV